jgi:phosphoserine phosphatase
MRRAGFMVGVVSDSYFVAADILRRRIFADFALAHTLQFDADTCTGEVHLNPAFMPLRPSPGAPPDKGHVVRRFRRDAAHTPWQTIWAVGDHVNDLDMLREADRAFVIEPKSAWPTSLNCCRWCRQARTTHRRERRRRQVRHGRCLAVRSASWDSLTVEAIS